MSSEQTLNEQDLSVEGTGGAGRTGEARITMEVLHVVHGEDNLSQRGLAARLNIALGLTNAYLKRCVRIGLVKVRKTPPNRYVYYLTPKGFGEKSRLTANYLFRSFDFYRQARKTDWVRAPLFPRYLFVAADPQLTRSRAINSAPGVIGLVAFGERPGLISDLVIQAIRAREDAVGLVQLVDRDSLMPGEQDCLQSGAMADHAGLFERRGDGERVVILLHLLGREVRVKVRSNAIARVL